MWSKIKQVFISPVFEDGDNTRIANLLSATILILFLIAVVRTILVIGAAQEYLAVVLRTNGILIVVLAGVFVLMRTGYVRFASIVLICYQWMVIAWLTYHYGGVRLSVYSFFIFVILAAGLLLGGKWAVGYATISVIYGALLLYLENQGVISPILESSIGVFSTITPSFITTAVLVYLYHRDIIRALTQERNNTIQLAQANEALRERDDQLIGAQKVAKLGHYVFDIKTGYWTSSAGLDDIFGTDENFKKDVAGWLQIVHPDFTETMSNYLQDNILRQHQKFYKEYKIINIKTGQDKWVHGLGSLKFDDNNNPVEMFGTIQDITEHKQARDALKDSEERLKSFYDAAFEGIALTRQGKLIDANRQFCKLFGYERDELIGREVLDLVAEEDRELVLSNIKSGFEKPYEHRAVHKDGTAIFLEIKGQQIQFQGQSARVTAIHDISERKHSEAALRESEEKYRLLVEDINDVIYRTDQNGIITYVSPVVKSVAGYDPSELIGQRFIKIVYEKDIELLAGRFQELISGVIRPSVYRVVNKANEPIWVRSSSKLIYDGKNIVGVRGVITDISEEKRLQFQLEQGLKMEAIGTLAGGIAHDFNNILSAIIGFSELALGKTSIDTKLHDNIKQVLKAGHRAKDLVVQILSFSRKGTQEQKPIDVIPMVKETLKLIRASLPSTIEIRQNYEADPGVIMADPTQVHQVLMNLCTNAGAAMRETGGILEVKLAKVDLDSDFAAFHQSIEPGPHVVLTVSDTGHGMPPAVLGRIFEPFFTTKERGEGTGMGLAVVHGIVESHGGTITVDSKPGKGSTFQVYLPLVEEEEKLEIKVEEPIPRGTERILVIDDEEAVLNLSKQMLEQLGYKVETRTSSVEALELFNAKPDRFDLVITDMTMPNMTGDQLAKKMMKIRPDIPIILCTGFSERITETKAKRIGIRSYLMKPVTERNLGDIVRQVLGS